MQLSVYKSMESHLPDHKPDDNGAPYKIVNQERKILKVQKVCLFLCFIFQIPFPDWKGKMPLLHKRYWRRRDNSYWQSNCSVSLHKEQEEMVLLIIIPLITTQKVLLPIRGFNKFWSEPNIIFVKGSVSSVFKKSFSWF